MENTTPIEDYAVIGDSRTTALVGPSGSIDWLCLPDLDSPACFAALLGGPEHGRWLLTVDGAETTTRRYRDHGFVLETTFTTPSGTAVMTECMPTDGERADVVRRLECTAGTVQVRQELVIRFGYGRIAPWASRTRDANGREVLRMVAGPDGVTFHGRLDGVDRLPTGRRHQHVDEHPMTAGQVLETALTWTPSWAPLPAAVEVDAAIDETAALWREWIGTCGYDGEHAAAVQRSLLVLRLLTNDETGGIAAAATTSLPEEFGGVRNWDYRYCWLRDSALTLEALLDFGYAQEAADWRSWLLRAVAGDPADLQIMYRLDGGRELPERELDHLPGYAGSRPVRIGNGAVGQVQHDVLGEVMAALDAAREAGIAEDKDSWSLQTHLVDELITQWREPDHGIWEIRGPRRHFTQSKIMCWAAVDRAISGVRRHGLPGPVETWERVAGEIRADVLAHGVDPVTNSFVQHYETTEVDASLLTVVPLGFLPPRDPRIVNTVHRIRDELADGAHVLRYRTSSGVDGLPEGEHHFLACSFWLVDALARIGEVDDARARFTELVGVANDVGLLAEEYDPANRRFAGNFPQALSHLGLVRAAHTLDVTVR